MTTDTSATIAAARAAVVDAATVCRAVQAELETVRTVLKDDKSPVTVADFAAQAIIGHRLTEALGPIKLVGEEDAHELRDQIANGSAAVAEAVLNAVQKVWPDATLERVLDAIDIGNAEPERDGLTSYWTLDPVDGTKGFLRGQQYAVSLGWIEQGTVTLGVLACPNLSTDQNAPFDTPDRTGSVYVAQLDAGARESACAHDGDDRPFALEDFAGGPIRVCASVEKAHSSVSDTDRVLERIGEAGEPARLDSQAKYAVVARGQADAYLRLPTKKGYVERIWDHAAGSLIATEAGAIVSDIHGEPLDFSKGKGLSANSGVVCATKGLHERIIEAIEELNITPA
jgi:3'(2'), 5'-bisphosphate nucleotidase